MHREDVITEFNRVYYDEEHKSPILNNTLWMGYPIVKSPTDLMAYQEIIFEVKPRLIIETGSWKGGSGLFFAHMLELVHGLSMIHSTPMVISIDIHDVIQKPLHPYLHFKKGSSTDPHILQYVKECLNIRQPVMVILDSDHRAEYVYRELESYASFISVNSYLVVEDTNINGHPVLNGWGAGPMEAVQAWLPNHPEFQADKSREKFLLTMNPNGFLRRVS